MLCNSLDCPDVVVLRRLLIKLRKLWLGAIKALWTEGDANKGSCVATSRQSDKVQVAWDLSDHSLEND